MAKGPFIPMMVDRAASSFVGWYQPDSEIEIDGSIYRFSADGAEIINNLREEIHTDPTVWDALTHPSVPQIKLQKAGEHNYTTFQAQRVLLATGIVIVPLPQ